MNNLTLKQIINGLRNRKFSSVELVKYYLNKSEKENDINAYIELYDDALEAAQKADEQIAQGKESALLGVPVAIKDNILIKGKITSAGSDMLKDYTAVYDATVVKKLKKSGAVFLGRTNMDEFAMGSSTETSAYGITKNPVDKTKVPGGSSGGSAAVVSTDLSPIALGTDTGGSIRQPASFCGVVGFKPSYGRVSRYGIIAMGSSLDQVGPLAKSVEDAEIFFNIIQGKDEYDQTTIDKISVKIKDTYKIAFPKKFIDEYVAESVKEAFYNSIKKLEKSGHLIEEVELPNIDKALLAYYIIMSAEVSANLARFDGIRYSGIDKKDLPYKDLMQNARARFGTEVKRRILLGSFVLSAGYYDAYYRKAVALRWFIKSMFDNIFNKYDFVVTPTSPTEAFNIGSNLTPTQMYAADIFTVPVNIAYLPAISVPMQKEGLPAGIQFIGRHNHDEQVLDIGKKFEKMQ